jgi:hypothetical protein
MKRKTKKPGSRVARHRRKQQALGIKRIEISVPARDASLLQQIAARLRRGGSEATMLRQNLRSAAPSAATGLDLIAFLRASPLVGADLDLERDKSTGRPVEI